MGRKRFKTRRALLIVFLATFAALAIIAVLARQPAWYLSLLSRDAKAEMTRGAPFPVDPGSYGDVDPGDWVLPAIVVVVCLSGVASFRVLLKANR